MGWQGQSELGVGHRQEHGWDLRSQLVQANCECAHLEKVLEELPAIMEHRFSIQLKLVTELNEHLRLQNAELLRALQSQNCNTQKRLCDYKKLSVHAPRLLTPIVISGLVILLAGPFIHQYLWRASFVKVDRDSSLRRSIGSDSTAILKLAAHGSSWVEVQDLETKTTLFVGILHAGEQRTIRMRRGLRLRSGRPDLLSSQVDGGPRVPLGTIPQSGWRVLLPPPLKNQRA